MIFQALSIFFAKLLRLSLPFVVLFAWSCANRVPPTGGPKDKKPPKLLHSVPTSGDRNFRGRLLALEFDEYIQANKFKDQLIITPRINGSYTYKIRKRTVLIEFDSAFAPNTTYTLNFREAIVDITEKNPARDLVIAFSTGDHLDTLTLSGQVNDLLTDLPAKDVTIGLYPEDDTLDIFSGQPYYFTRTNKGGHYEFGYLKQGRYRLYAFADNNKNLTCQSRNEPYGFLPAPIAIDTNTIADTLYLVQLNIDSLKITRTRSSGRYFLVSANKYITDTRLQAANDSILYYRYTDNHKTLKFYKTFDVPDSLAVYATLTDSAGFVVQDTFYVQFPETNRRPDEFKVNYSKPHASKTYRYLKGTISFAKPLTHINPDSIYIRYDSLEFYPLKESIELRYDTANLKLYYHSPIPAAIFDSLEQRQKKVQNKNLAKPTAGRDLSSMQGKARGRYELVFATGTFISVEQDTAEAYTKELQFTEASQFALLTGKVNASQPYYIIQLLNNKYKVVEEEKNVSEYTFKEIPPGEYMLRVLIDSNGNGRWDAGNILRNQLPEPVIIYHDEAGNRKTALRANWEVQIDLQF